MVLYSIAEILSRALVIRSPSNANIVNHASMAA
jgi:hypothetical protein